MIHFLIRRILASALLLLAVLTAVFFVLHLAPGDPLALLDTPRIPAEHREALRESWGLDRPLSEQYVRWISRAVRGDWGTSFGHHQPVTGVIFRALPATALLGASALLLQLLIAVPLGTLAAWRAGSASDRVLRAVSLVAYSTPTFWLGLMAISLFAYRWPIFPPSHLESVTASSLGEADRWLDRLHHLALPALVLGLSGVGGWIRYVRSGVLEVLGQEHLTALRARGVSERRVLWVHALRGAVGPLLQVLGFTLPFLLSGALILEVLFSWPGLGQITYGALLGRDYPLLLASTAWSAGLVVIGSLIADLLHAWLDPRVREQLL